QLADLVAAQGKAGHVISLDEDLRPPKRGREARHRLNRGHGKTKGVARMRDQGHGEKLRIKGLERRGRRRALRAHWRRSGRRMSSASVSDDGGKWDRTAKIRG